MPNLEIRHDYRSEGYREFGLYRDGKLVACVSRPVPRGRWFLQAVGERHPRGRKFATMKAAIAAANEHQS